jgi:hypothetical protein
LFDSGAARLNFTGGIDILAAGSVDKRRIVMPNMAISERLAMVMLPLAYVFAQTPGTLLRAGVVIVEPPTTGQPISADKNSLRLIPNAEWKAP